MIARKLSSILIVEDERIVAKDLQETLVNMGYDAFAVASSAEEAIARAAERRPDLVLMDIRIKGQRDGVETAKILRERFEVPVIYLTAHSDDATLERAGKTGPFGYLLSRSIRRSFAAPSKCRCTRTPWRRACANGNAGSQRPSDRSAMR